MIINAYVSGCIRRLEENVYDKKQIIDVLKIVNHHVELAGKFIHSMKDDIRRIELHHEKINIHHVIKSAHSLIAYELRPFSIDIQYAFSENLPLIELDEEHIKLVIMHLLKNSIEEMSEAKTKQSQIVIETAQINALTIAVCIKDKRRGISTELQKKLFNAYFTNETKNIGMSLTTCRSIIEAHNGHITVQSLPEGGACFRFTLPIRQ